MGAPAPIPPSCAPGEGTCRTFTASHNPPSKTVPCSSRPTCLGNAEGGLGVLSGEGKLGGAFSTWCQTPAAHKLTPEGTSSRWTLDHQHQHALQSIHDCRAVLLAHVDAREGIKSRGAPWHPFCTLPPRALQHRCPPRREDFTLTLSWVLSCLNKNLILQI